MLPLVVALTLTTSWTSSLPPLPSLPPGVLSRVHNCPDTDPSFDRRVAPPEGMGPLWAITDGQSNPTFVRRAQAFGPSTTARVLRALPPQACSGLIPASR